LDCCGPGCRRRRSSACKNGQQQGCGERRDQRSCPCTHDATGQAVRAVRTVRRKVYAMYRIGGRLSWQIYDAASRLATPDAAVTTAPAPAYISRSPRTLSTRPTRGGGRRLPSSSVALLPPPPPPAAGATT